MKKERQIVNRLTSESHGGEPILAEVKGYGEGEKAKPQDPRRGVKRVRKDLLLVYCHRAANRAASCDYIIGSHAPLVMRTPGFEDVFERYTMNAAVDVREGESSALLYGAAPDLLMVVEHVFDQVKLAAAVESPEYLAKVRPDEEYIGRVLLQHLPAAYDAVEQVIFAAAAEPGSLRVFDFLRRRSDLTEAAFEAALADEADRLAADRDYRSVVLKRVHNRIGDVSSLFAPTARDVDAIVETWVTGFDALAALQSRLRQSAYSFVDSGASFSVLARETKIIV
ncbi:EthD domain-containing protein [Variovorax sp. YR752]|uniref:EthD domain-containing protein n=1 Tax=unclassified Variovorax TaxID=663243 RepID=UPI000BDC9158|nr:EthD domain-containing protein [Variovorax sp. YR752]SOE06282.1 EthD domain-containing protein [Variovorax sp. YR752]